MNLQKRSIRIGAIVATGAAAWMLWGCAPHMDEHDPKPFPEATAAHTVTQSVAGIKTDDANRTDNWWERSGETRLRQLIEKVMQANPSLEAARYRLKKAGSDYAAINGGTGPQIGLDANFEQRKASDNALLSPPFVPRYYGQHWLYGRLNYDLDLWGANSAKVEAALGALEAQRFEFAFARLSLSLSVADAYYRYAASQETLGLLRRIEADDQNYLDLIRKRVAAGLQNGIAVKEAEAALSRSRRRIAMENSRGKSALRDLCDTAGMPEAQLQPYLPEHLHAAAPGVPPVSLNALGQRPDIREKVALVHSARAGVKAAKAAFYPDISLSALGGLSSIDLNKLLRTNSSTGALGVAVSLPLFDGGVRDAQFHAADSAYAAAVADYNAAVLHAANETVWSIRQLRTLARAHTILNTELAQEQGALFLARQRYDAGIDPRMPLLEASHRRLETQAQAVALDLAQKQGHLALIRAVGGRL